MIQGMLITSNYPETVSKYSLVDTIKVNATWYISQWITKYLNLLV